MVSWSVPIFYQTTPLRSLSLLIVGHCELQSVFLGLKKWWSAIQIGTSCYVLVFHSILTIHIYHQVSKTQSIISVFMSGSICSLPELPASVSHGLLIGEPHSQLWSLPLLLVDRTALIGILCIKGYKRTMSSCHPPLPYFSTHRYIYFMNPGGHF